MFILKQSNCFFFKQISILFRTSKTATMPAQAENAPNFKYLCTCLYTHNGCPQSRASHMSPRNNTLKYPYFDILPITKAKKGYSQRVAGSRATQRVGKQRKKVLLPHKHTHAHTYIRSKEVRLTPCT